MAYSCFSAWVDVSFKSRESKCRFAVWQAVISLVSGLTIKVLCRGQSSIRSSVMFISIGLTSGFGIRETAGTARALRSSLIMFTGGEFGGYQSENRCSYSICGWHFGTVQKVWRRSAFLIRRDELFSPELCGWASIVTKRKSMTWRKRKWNILVIILCL